MKRPTLTWHFDLASFIPKPGELHLWLLDLEATKPAALGKQGEAWLSPEEQTRWKRFQAAQHRDWFLRRRVVARWLLGGVLDLPPGQVPLVHDRNGKPQLDPASAIFGAEGGPGQVPWAFNWSRSGPWFLFGLAQGGPLGVDLERWDEGLEVLPLAEAHGPPGLADDWNGLEPSARLEKWYGYWTGFEARTKAVGCGIAAKEALSLRHPAGREWFMDRQDFHLANARLTATVAIRDL